MQTNDTTRYTLELTRPEDFRPKLLERSDVQVRRAEIPLPPLNRFLHEAVGTDFQWGGREGWTLEDWTRFVDRPEFETWLLYVSGTPAGYFELEALSDGSVRMHTFGLLRPFFGQGLGGHLLSVALRRAFELGANRIWLRTTTMDHPHALPNYQARGFRIVHTETVKKSRDNDGEANN